MENEKLKKFSIPTYFNEKFLKQVLILNNDFAKKNTVIYELYGSLKENIFGQGRETEDLPSVTFNKLKTHIKDLHENNFQFNYLLNASCFGNIENTQKGRKKLFNFFDKLAELKIDTLTVSIPHLAELIKKNYPKIKVCASTICYIDSLEKALFYEDLGVDKITLDIDINRDFKLLQKIREKVKVELRVIGNSPCMLQCAMKYAHYNFTSHYNIKELNKKFCYFGECLSSEKCLLLRLKNPKNFISAPWIRPEDTDIYFNLGINYIKIAGRELTQDFIIKCAKAYLKGEYKGNLASLFMIPLRRYKYHRSLFIFIDNQKLSNFLKFFLEKERTCNKYCGDCTYCDEIAIKTVKINKKLRCNYIKYIEKEMDKKLIEKNY